MSITIIIPWTRRESVILIFPQVPSKILVQSYQNFYVIKFRMPFRGQEMNWLCCTMPFSLPHVSCWSFVSSFLILVGSEHKSQPELINPEVWPIYQSCCILGARTTASDILRQGRTLAMLMGSWCVLNRYLPFSVPTRKTGPCKSGPIDKLLSASSSIFWWNESIWTNGLCTCLNRDTRIHEAPSSMEFSLLFGHILCTVRMYWWFHFGWRLRSVT